MIALSASLMVILRLFDEDHAAYMPKSLMVKKHENSVEPIATVLLENNSYSISLEPGIYVAQTFGNFYFVFNVTEGNDTAILKPGIPCIVGLAGSDDVSIWVYGNDLFMDAC